MEKISAVLLVSVISLTFSVKVYAEQIDRSAVLPDLVQASKSAYSKIGDYKAENKKAEEAAKGAASDYLDRPIGERRIAKAKALCQWERSLNIMASKLEGVYSDMITIQNKIADGVVGNLGEAGARIDKLNDQMSAELTQQGKTYDAMLKVYEISPDAAGELGAQKINAIYDSMARRKEILKRLRERRGRIGAIGESIQMKLENIRAITDVISARITEIRTEAYVVNALKAEDQFSIVEEGLDIKGDAGQFLNDSTSKSIDVIMQPKGNAGLSERERLQRRLAGR